MEAWLADQGQRSPGNLSRVHRCWVEVVGAEVAAHVRPLALRDEVLVVAVDHPAWAAQMGFLAPRLLRGLEEALGAPVASRVEPTVRPRQGVE